jgi:formylmethanofuran dehydrogenase subunit E
MKEALFIFVVIGVLAALTAVRYRKQITGMINVARMLKETSRNVTGLNKRVSGEAKSIPLVNCSKCGVWVPQAKAIKVRDAYYCSNACLNAGRSVT